MQKIDVGGHQKTLNPNGASSSSGAGAAGAAVGLRRAGRTAVVEAKRRFGEYIDRMKLRRVASASQTSDLDLAPISQRSQEQLISDLSRILVTMEQSESKSDPTETDLLFKAMLHENIRRLVLLQRAKVNFFNGGV